MLKYQRHISIFLLFTLVLPILTSLSLLLYTSWIEHEMFERMEMENLEVILLNPSEINWKKQDKELKIGADYFDVKYIIQKSDKIELHGLFDKKEKAIEKLLHKSLSKRKNNDDKNSVFQFMQKMQFIKIGIDESKTRYCLEANLYFDLIENRYNAPILNIVSPPPNEYFCC